MADFTYEDIYELLRGEKYSTDLQQINPELLKKICQYFDLKKELMQKQKESALFEKSSRDQLKPEVENATRALRDLYERREKKIINRAIFTARSDFKIKDTTNFLPAEEKMYLCMVELLREATDGFFNAIKNAGIPEKKEDAVVEASQPAQASESSEPSVIFKEVKILQSIPQLTGPDLKSYGPYRETEVVKIPEEIATILLAQGKAAVPQTRVPIDAAAIVEAEGDGEPAD